MINKNCVGHLVLNDGVDSKDAGRVLTVESKAGRPSATAIRGI